MENVNNYLRKHIKFIYDSAKSLLGNQIRDDNMYSSVVFRGIYEQDYNNILLPPMLGTMSEKDKMEATLFQGLMESVMLMDLYTLLNKKYNQGISTSADDKLLNRIIECTNKDSYDRFNSLFIDPSTEASLVKASLEFLDSSAYDKVLAFKCLDTDDAITLVSINPYFTDDLKRYSIDINRDFLIRQINRWKAAFTEEESINAAATFLIDAFNMNINIEELVVDIINHAESEDVMQALVDENVELLSAFILAYYRTYNEDAPKLK